MVFSWYIVGYLFLAGAGAGAFFVSATACVWDALRADDGTERLLRAVQGGFVVAPCLMVLACLFLAADVGNLERAWAIATMPFASIVSTGAWLVALLTAVSAALAVAGLALAEVPRAVQWLCCSVGLLLAAGVMSYTGLLLSDMVSVDFWHTPWLVALFVASSLSTGLAAIDVCRALTGGRSGEDGGLSLIASVLTPLEAAFLAGMLVSQWGYTETARNSCELLLAGPVSPVFWGVVCCLGLAMPLAFRAVGRTTATKAVVSNAAMLASSAGTLAGGLALRYCVIAAALFTPMVQGMF